MTHWACGCPSLHVDTLWDLWDSYWESELKDAQSIFGNQWCHLCHEWISLTAGLEALLGLISEDISQRCHEIWHQVTMPSAQVTKTGRLMDRQSQTIWIPAEQVSSFISIHIIESCLFQSFKAVWLATINIVPGIAHSLAAYCVNIEVITFNMCTVLPIASSFCFLLSPGFVRLALPVEYIGSEIGTCCGKNDVQKCPRFRVV